MDSIGQQGNLHRAVSLGLEVLRLHGEDFPHPSNRLAITVENTRVKMAVSRFSNEDILSLRPMHDRTKMAAMQILSTMHFYAFQTGSAYTGMFANRMVWLTLKHGLTKLGAAAVGPYGLKICSKNAKQGYRFGQLALCMVAKTRAKEMHAKVYSWMYGSIHHWTQPIRDSLEPLRLAQQIGMQNGEVEFAMMSAYFEGLHSLFTGVPLPKVAELLTDAVQHNS
jgi:predicted ATPase